ncbi:hypothetical protein GALMADRAFT_214037 [Galerina marginata CBS 339.88]|uniref:Uncharacterized protein n=1 Tax=Galerina marginata (strain CBS 339.88) TaxID=685588 RepID=A0A067SJ93_GALM3|nr:hypothetical protein GALMADRAFT_214037 [Galerina marginata CBS 339.88]
MSSSREKFPKEMAQWIDKLYPEYDRKLGITKSDAEGLSDDPDLLEWKRKKRAEFVETFETSLDKVEKWQERFDRKFHNRKRTKTVELNKHFPSQSQLPILVLPESTTTTGRMLFERTHTNEFSKMATQRREALGQTSHFHAGYWKAAASAAWNALSDLEKKEWEVNAEIEDRAKNASGDIYKRNQEDIAFSIYNTLHSTIGPKPYQIGSAAYHVLYAFRDINDELQLGEIQVVDKELVKVGFREDFPDYDNSIRRSWSGYCGKVVSSNRPTEYSKLFSESKNGHYLLPPFDEENSTASELRQTLKAFFECSWDCTWPRSSEMPGLPWSELIKNPEIYFHPLLHFKPITSISRLDNMMPPDLRNLSKAIVVFQGHPDTDCFSIFQAKADISYSRDKLSAWLEFEKVAAQEPQEVDYPSRSPTPSSSLPAFSSDFSFSPSLSSPFTVLSGSNPTVQFMPFETPAPTPYSFYAANPSQSIFLRALPQNLDSPSQLMTPPSFEAENTSIDAQAVTPNSMPSASYCQSSEPVGPHVLGSSGLTQLEPSVVPDTSISHPPLAPAIADTKTAKPSKRKRTKVVEEVENPSLGKSRIRTVSKKARGLNFDEKAPDDVEKGLATDNGKSKLVRPPKNPGGGKSSSKRRKKT